MKTDAKTTVKKTRVLLVDDHPMTRDGIALLINQEPDLEVVGQAGSAAEALRIAAKEHVDAALVDVTLPDKSGIELIRDLRALRPDLQILVVSMHEEELYGERALRAGARGYLSKQEGGIRLMQAVRDVIGGQVVVSEAIRKQILESVSGQSSSRSNGSIKDLTDREMEVFRLIGLGLCTAEIARRLEISPKTVETHRVNIKKKLNLGAASELIAYAARRSESGAD